MKLVSVVAVFAAILCFNTQSALAAKPFEEAGVIVCVSDKWDEKEREKGHKLVDYAGRCVKVPDNSAAAKSIEVCKGNYEYMPDGSWKGSGTCNVTQSKDDTLTITWEEGSHLKENTYKATSGTGKFNGVGGGGMYKYDQLTDTLFGGRYSTRFEMP